MRLLKSKAPVNINQYAVSEIPELNLIHNLMSLAHSLNCLMEEAQVEIKTLDLPSRVTQSTMRCTCAFDEG